MLINDEELKRAALVGLRHERRRMDELIARLERELGTHTGTSAAIEAGPASRKRRMSAAGRANIIAALKKRWAAMKKAKTVPKPSAAAKRKPASKAAVPEKRAPAKHPVKAAKRAAAPVRPAKKSVAKPTAKTRTTTKTTARKPMTPKAATPQSPSQAPIEVIQTPEVPVS